MSYEVKFKEEADLDIFDARQLYESRRSGLGNEFLDELEEYVKILEQDPQIHQIRKHNWRYCPLKRFPYVIVVEIEKLEVIKFAVFNTYQNPNHLNNRNNNK